MPIRESKTLETDITSPGNSSKCCRWEEVKVSHRYNTLTSVAHVICIFFTTYPMLWDYMLASTLTYSSLLRISRRPIWASCEPRRVSSSQAQDCSDLLELHSSRHCHRSFGQDFQDCCGREGVWLERSVDTIDNAHTYQSCTLTSSSFYYLQKTLICSTSLNNPQS